MDDSTEVIEQDIIEQLSIIFNCNIEDVGELIIEIRARELGTEKNLKAIEDLYKQQCIEYFGLREAAEWKDIIYEYTQFQQDSTVKHVAMILQLNKFIATRQEILNEFLRLGIYNSEI